MKNRYKSLYTHKLTFSERERLHVTPYLTLYTHLSIFGVPKKLSRNHFPSGLSVLSFLYSEFVQWIQNMAL
jgi:hypothetical protein